MDYIQKQIRGDAKMDVFWKIYCTMDETGRKELMKRHFSRPINNSSRLGKVN